MHPPKTKPAPPPPSKEWSLLEPDPKLVTNLSKELKISNLLAKLLVNRGVCDPQRAREYLKPNFEQLRDPSLLPGVKKAIRRLRAALGRGESILVFGDDDVDGITSTSVIYLFLRDLGAKVDYFIPQRQIHGHGLNPVSIVAAIEKSSPTLLIATDCGTSSVNEVAWLSDRGIDCIIVDHHTAGDQLPDAVSIINPQVAVGDFEFKELAAVGVAFNLIFALFLNLKKIGLFESIKEPDIQDYLDLVALGTVADVVSLQDQNRVYVKLGLEVLRRRRRCGVAALLDRIHLNHQPITERTICYRLAPRINAAGRVGDANKCVNLLTTNDYALAHRLAKCLEEYNILRQETESEILAEAIIQAEEQVAAKRYVLVIAKEGWNQGVLGIVASRLLERFQRPAILIAMNNGRARGSARSPVGVNVLNCIRACQDLLDNYGGHNYAAGLALQSKNLELFKAKVESAARELLGPAGLPIPTLPLDAELNLDDFDLSRVQEIEQLAPFGTGNREPTFLIQRLRPIRSWIVGRNHLRLRFRTEQMTSDVIGFSMGDLRIRHGRQVDVVLTPRIIDKDRDKIELRMQGIQPSILPDLTGE